MLPTKIERSMWFYSLKNMKKELVEWDEEAAESVEVAVFKGFPFRRDPGKPWTSIPIANKKRLGQKVDIREELGLINRRVIDANTKMYEEMKRGSLEVAEAQTKGREATGEPEESVLRFDEQALEGSAPRRRGWSDGHSVPDLNISALEINEEFNFMDNDSFTRQDFIKKLDF